METATTFKLGVFPFTNDPTNVNGNGVNGPCWSRDADNHQGFSTGPLAATVDDPPNAPGVQVVSGATWVGSNETTTDHSYTGGRYTLEVKIPLAVLPSAVDPTVAPPGRHLMSMFVQYAPYTLREGSWDDLREVFADRCFDLLDEYAPNFKRSVLARQVLTPLDLERVFNLTGGNIFQGAMTPSQLFAFRPVPGYARYRTPIKGLYLCGAAAHPGGGVMGTPGLNAAREILGRRRLRASV